MYVFVVNDKKIVQNVSDTTGPTYKGNVVISKGLKEGQMVIINANVPINETGIVMAGIIVALKFCMKKKTTKNTRPKASNKVIITSLIEAFTNMVVS